MSEIVGWSVHDGPIGTGAFYNLSEKAKAFDAAKRWGCCITALTQCPNTPAFGASQITPSVPYAS